MTKREVQYTYEVMTLENCWLNTMVGVIMYLEKKETHRR